MIGKGTLSIVAALALAAFGLAGPPCRAEAPAPLDCPGADGAFALSITDGGLGWILQTVAAEVLPIEHPSGRFGLELAEGPTVTFLPGRVEVAIGLRPRLHVPLPKGKSWDPKLWALHLRAELLVDPQPDADGFFRVRLGQVHAGKGGLGWTVLEKLARRELSKAKVFIKLLNALFVALKRQAPVDEHVELRLDPRIVVALDLDEGASAALQGDLGAVRLSGNAPALGRIRFGALHIEDGVAHAVGTLDEEEARP